MSNNTGFFKYFRLREPVHLVKGATRRTHCAVVVAAFPSTFKRKPAPNVDSPEPRPVDTDGPLRPGGVTQPAPAA